MLKVAFVVVTFVLAFKVHSRVINEHHEYAQDMGRITGNDYVKDAQRIISNTGYHLTAKDEGETINDDEEVSNRIMENVNDIVEEGDDIASHEDSGVKSDGNSQQYIFSSLVKPEDVFMKSDTTQRKCSPVRRKSCYQKYFCFRYMVMQCVDV